MTQNIPPQRVSSLAQQLAPMQQNYALAAGTAAAQQRVDDGQALVESPELGLAEANWQSFLSLNEKVELFLHQFYMGLEAALERERRESEVGLFNRIAVRVMAYYVYDAVRHLEDSFPASGVLSTRLHIGQMVAGQFSGRISQLVFSEMLEAVNNRHSGAVSSVTLEYKVQGSEELLYSEEGSDALRAVSRAEHIAYEVYAQGGNPFVVQATAATERTRDAGVKTGQNLEFQVRKTRTTFVEECWNIQFTKLEFNGERGQETSYQVELELKDPDCLFEDAPDGSLEIITWGMKVCNEIISSL
jgi:hypothetical protein